MSGDDVTGLWPGYHNALGLKKSTPPGAREQSVRIFCNMYNSHVLINLILSKRIYV